LLKLDQIATAAATGVGNPVIYLGSATGKDGIHGATFASTELDEDSDTKRPNVQIGDPFAEKQLIEATLESLQSGAVVAIQDMGAAGLTCSTVEMSSKGGVGMAIDLDLVPMRESDMTAYELMLSESQERMLAVAEPGRENEILDVFRRWGLKAEVIGHVTDDGLVTVKRNGRIEAQLDPKLLTDHCPVYESPAEEPSYFRAAAEFDVSSVSEIDVQTGLPELLATPEIASKRWVYRQYDQHVQTQTTVSSGEGDAAVLAPRGIKKGIALAIDGNARQTFLHPYIGGQLAVVEAARNVACSGAMPSAVTDGLNFGSPQDPHVYWQFTNAVKGIADAADAMGTPVISGNVSFYNESELGEVPPTPIIGMLGVLDDVNDRLGIAPGQNGDLCLLFVRGLEIGHEGLGASAALAYLSGQENGYPVAPNFAGESNLARLLVEAAREKLILSAHDVSEGGIAVTLAEIAIASGMGIEATLEGDAFDYSNRCDARAFGEIPGMVVVSVPSGDYGRLKERAERLGLSTQQIGWIAETEKLTVKCAGKQFSWAVVELKSHFEQAIEAAVSDVL
jgi:phosphoribosylformylglycinamidine synthase